MPVKTQTKQITKPGYIKRAAGLAFLRGAMLAILTVALTVCSVPFPVRMTAWASEVEITSDKIPHGKTGKKMTLSFRIKNTGDASMREIGRAHV